MARIQDKCGKQPVSVSEHLSADWGKAHFNGRLGENEVRVVSYFIGKGVWEHDSWAVSCLDTKRTIDLPKVSMVDSNCTSTLLCRCLFSGLLCTS
jgi:hypothetical protein